jgi:hypothetical protein
VASVCNDSAIRSAVRPASAASPTSERRELANLNAAELNVLLARLDEQRSWT